MKKEEILNKLKELKSTYQYVDGFSKLLKIDSIKDELQSVFKKEIDFVPSSNKKIIKDLINV